MSQTVKIDPNLAVPSEILYKKCGNNQNPDVGYVTYRNKEGKLMRENSWTKWSKSTPYVLSNAPRAGFTIYGSLGGGRDWGKRQSWIQIQDPGGFIIEISPDNLIELITTVGYTPDTGFNKPLSYAWFNGCLELRALTQEEFNTLTTEPAKAKVKLKDLLAGHYYKSKTIEGYYLGRHLTFRLDRPKTTYRHHAKNIDIKTIYEKLHVFKKADGEFMTVKSTTLPFIEQHDMNILVSQDITDAVKEFIHTKVCFNRDIIEQGQVLAKFFVPDEAYKTTPNATTKDHSVYLMSPDETELYDVNLIDYWSDVPLNTCRCSLGNHFRIENGIVRECFKETNNRYYQMHATYYKGIYDLAASLPDWKLFILDDKDNPHTKFPAVVDDKGQQFYHNYKL